MRKIFNLWKKVALNAFINHDSKGEIYFVEIPFELWGGLITSVIDSEENDLLMNLHGV